MVEFAINSSVNETTGFAPFEINYTRMPSVMPKIHMSQTVHKGIREFVEAAQQNLNDAYDAIIARRVFQKVQADKHRRVEPEIKAGDKVFLATKDLALPKGRAGKFLPKFIGPYLVLEAKPDVSTYRLDLSDELKHRNIHPVFHVSRLRPYHSNDDKLFPGRSSVTPYDFGEPDEETGVEAIDGHQWKARTLRFHVKWIDGTDTWERLSVVNDCVALDEYLKLQGVQEPSELSKRVQK
jgi:hypothetical protein